MPTTRGGPAGSFLSRLTRRSSVSGLVGIPRRAARREPASPPSDEPMSVWVCRSRSVVRARGAANPGRRSAKMRRGQPDVGHTKRRMATRSRTRRPRQGRYSSRRVYRLRTRRASEPQTGQAAVGAVIARWTVSCSTSRQARTRQLPSGAPSNSSGSNARLRGRSLRRGHVATRYALLRPRCTESAGEPEYGAWHPDRVTRSLTGLVETAPGRLWYGYHVSALDDTQVHRSGPHVWGTCTFHEYTARCPNRATTVRAHNWVVLGALLQEPQKPAWFLPLSGQLYFRKSQLPQRPGQPGRTEPFRTKCEL